MPYITNPSQPNIVIVTWPGHVSTMDFYQAVCEACDWTTGFISACNGGWRNGDVIVYVRARKHALTHSPHPRLHPVTMEEGAGHMVVSGPAQKEEICR